MGIVSSQTSPSSFLSMDPSVFYCKSTGSIYSLTLSVCNETLNPDNALIGRVLNCVLALAAICQLTLFILASPYRVAVNHFFEVFEKSNTKCSKVLHFVLSVLNAVPILNCLVCYLDYHWTIRYFQITPEYLKRHVVKCIESSTREMTRYIEVRDYFDPRTKRFFNYTCGFWFRKGKHIVPRIAAQNSVGILDKIRLCFIKDTPRFTWPAAPDQDRMTFLMQSRLSVTKGSPLLGYQTDRFGGILNESFYVSLLYPESTDVTNQEGVGSPKWASDYYDTLLNCSMPLSADVPNPIFAKLRSRYEDLPWFEDFSLDEACKNEFVTQVAQISQAAPEEAPFPRIDVTAPYWNGVRFRKENDVGPRPSLPDPRYWMGKNWVEERRKKTQEEAEIQQGALYASGS